MTDPSDPNFTHAHELADIVDHVFGVEDPAAAPVVAAPVALGDPDDETPTGRYAWSR